MNEKLLNTEIDKLGHLYEALKDELYKMGAYLPHLTNALGLLLQMRDQAAINIQQLADLADGPMWLIHEELAFAEKKHPDWPHDKVYAAAIVQEEAGELGKAALQYHQEGGAYKAMIAEAIQVGAMAVRFLKNAKDTSIPEDVFDCSAT